MYPNNPPPNSGAIYTPYPHTRQPDFNPAYHGIAEYGGGGGAYPPPGGAYPPPGGADSPPGGAHPQPGGVYPPQQPSGYPPPGDYPPPGGYGPPQGSTAPGFMGPGNDQYQPQPAGYPSPDGYGPQQPISQQPTANDGWMGLPQVRPTDCPPGLEYLTTIDQLLVHQKVELLEAFIGFETQNKYTVKNSLGQKVFYAVEDASFLTRCCWGPIRPFNMKIMDNFKNEVIHFNRPLACTSCCCPCCLQTIEVYAPVGQLVGTVEQEWSILTPQFKVKNALGDTIFRIEGPICTFSICGDVEFKILTLGNDVVGKITRQWSGLLREAFTLADYFGITFPVDLDVKMKAVMLGACFLIDFMFYERKGSP